MHDVLDIAKYIILLRKEQGKGTTNLKLQKILYFLQCYYVDYLGHPCFEDDFVAWAYGPAIPKVYFEFCSWGAEAIRLWNETVPEIPKKDKKIIAYIVSMCDIYNARELVDITQKQNVWKSVYDHNKDNIMKKNTLKSFFPECEDYKIPTGKPTE